MWRTHFACRVETRLDACFHRLHGYMTAHRRRLPHLYPEGVPLFLTWHLHGSLRSLRAKPDRIREIRIYRNQSSEGGVSRESRGLSMVERRRRDESRRGTHECMRHIKLALVGGPHLVRT